jgi:hypothetical protein
MNDCTHEDYEVLTFEMVDSRTLIATLSCEGCDARAKAGIDLPDLMVQANFTTDDLEWEDA